MKILVINPNSSIEMTESIKETVRAAAGDRFEAEVCRITEAPPFIGSYADQLASGPHLLRLLKEQEDNYDGFIIACHLDPCLDAAKEITGKPVMGIGEVSMRMAPLLGRKFSVVGSSSTTTYLKRRMVEQYGLEKFLASVRAPKPEWTGSQEELLIRAAGQAVREDGADVIVLGCAGFTGLDEAIKDDVKVPVLDGVACALAVMEGVLNMRGCTCRK